MKKLKHGFTLIELLVVIAIIGLLSSIVLASLGSARNKAKISSATGSMSAMRAQAELGNANGVYIAAMCGTNNSVTTGGLLELITAVQAQGTGNVVCSQNNARTSWAAIVGLAPLGGSGASAYFCVDSNGFAGYRTVSGLIGDAGTNFTCPAS